MPIRFLDIGEPCAATMQLENCLALTLSLSPKERGQLLPLWK